MKRQIEYIICGEEQMKKQRNAKEHVEIFLRFNLRSFLSSRLVVTVLFGATVFYLRFALAMTDDFVV